MNTYRIESDNGWRKDIFTIVAETPQDALSKIFADFHTMSLEEMDTITITRCPFDCEYVNPKNETEHKIIYAQKYFSRRIV